LTTIFPNKDYSGHRKAIERKRRSKEHVEKRFGDFKYS